MSGRPVSRARTRTRQLLRIGRAAGRRAEAGRIRWIALFCAAATLALAFLSLAAAHATYDGRNARLAARLPVSGPEGHGGGSKDKVIWSPANDTVHGSPFTAVFLEPLSDKAPLPPGLDRWPQPGEAVLSPALAEDGADEGIAHRYGRVVGTIGEDGLASPGERLAYVRPAAGLGSDPKDPYAYTGFGAPQEGQGPVGDGPYLQPEKSALLLIGFCLLLPAGILLLIAVRTGAHHRDRRTALADALGGTPRDRALVAVGEAVVPVLWGAGVAALPLAACLTVNCRVPVVDYLLSAQDLRAWAWLLALCLPLAAGLVLAGVVCADRVGRRPRRAVRPLGRRRLPSWTAVLFPVALLVAVRGPEYFAPGSGARMLFTYASAAVAMATLPLAVAAGTAASGRLQVRAGHRFASPALIVSGRRAQAHPGAVARLVSGVVVAIALLVQVQVWNGFMGDPARAAQATKDRIGSSLLVVEGSGAYSRGELDRVLSASPVPTVAVALTTYPEGDRGTVLQGPCEALKVLSLPCGGGTFTSKDRFTDPRTAELIRWYGDPAAGVTVRAGEVAPALAAEDAGHQLILVSADGSALDAPDFKAAFYKVAAMGADVDNLGGSWLAPALVREQQGSWIVLFGAAGVLVLGLAFGLSGLAECLRTGRAIAPLSVLTGNRRVFALTTAYGLLVPMALAGAGGCVLGGWLATPMTSSGVSHLSGSLLAACAGGVVLLGVALWGWGARASTVLARGWRPRGD
ncbi:hypothetical protein [Streptomyces rimosus]|uniref:hypothetical protein n=1 Tax=Streptomyces rimosus TaxID=1927 RepID=UPI00067E4D21|nr:hypothetical protein [Streptomyces rimosus]